MLFIERLTVFLTVSDAAFRNRQHTGISIRTIYAKPNCPIPLDFILRVIIIWFMCSVCTQKYICDIDIVVFILATIPDRPLGLKFISKRQTIRSVHAGNTDSPAVARNIHHVSPLSTYLLRELAVSECLLSDSNLTYEQRLCQMPGSLTCRVIGISLFVLYIQ
jgi:hypothetical protein